MSGRTLRAILAAAVAATAVHAVAPEPEQACGTAASDATLRPVAEAPGLVLVQAKPPGLSRLPPPRRQALLASSTASWARNGTQDSSDSVEAIQCLFGVPVTFTSHRLQNLQDNEGILNLNGDKHAWEQWTLADAGNGEVVLQGEFGKHLGDDNANPVLLDEGHEWSKWRIQYAGDSRFFLTSHRNEHLGDWEGVLTMHGNKGEWEKWYINTLNGSMACSSPQAEKDELQSLRARALHAEELLFQSREILAAGCSTTRTTTEVTPGVPDIGRCAVFGDPHFITFDGGHTTFVGDRILWVVRSRDVWMQAVSKLATGNFMGFAVGGPFMGGHTLEVYNASDGGPLHAYYDGQRILEQMDDEFRREGIVDAWRSSSWNSSLHDSKILNVKTEMRFDIGPFPERFLGEPEGGLFYLRLPGHVEVTITGVDFMSAVITMPPQEGGQSGYCGDFDGDSANDFEPIAPSWNRPVGTDLGPVSPSMVLFKNSKVFKMEMPSFLAESAEQRALNGKLLAHVLEECPEKLKAQARQECNVVSDVRMRDDCIFDICHTKDLSAAQGTLAAEVMEDKVNIQGAVAFMGHGRCLDAQGRQYAVFQTLDTRSEKECKKLLRDLSFTKGVLGAELLRTSTCQILVEQDADLKSVLVDGTWKEGGKQMPSGTAGEGLVAGTTDEPAWSCWTAI